MRIGEAAKETGLSVSNIRFYEKKGLLRPRRKEESRYREYGTEDIRRLKEIMLLRKMGLSVESIYLMYEGQAELSVLLKRQEQELAEQMEMLSGSLNLCRRIRQEGALEELDVDRWLNYVHEEEGKGQKFAAVEELLEDLAEYSRMAAFRGDPYVGKFFRKKYVAEITALLLLLLLVWAAASRFLEGRGSLPWIGFWIIYFTGIGLGFYWFRKKRREED